MRLTLLRRAGLRPWHLWVAALVQIAVCIGLWARAKTVDQEERGNAERRALFVGLWPPTTLLVSYALGEDAPTRRGWWRPR